MAMERVRVTNISWIEFGIALGVGFAVWPHYGWWAILYGIFWEVWGAYRLASWLLS